MKPLKVLFVTRSFAPDNIIAAKRISMLAKYLHKRGHMITVIRSGLIVGKAEMSNLCGLERVKIYSYNGLDSVAELFEKGNTINVLEQNNNNKQNISKRNKTFINLNIIKKLGHFPIDPIKYSLYEGNEIKKKIISLYDNCNDIRGFDIVISSFGPLGCIQAGEYIKKQENAKWIIDFRDLMDNQAFSPLLRIINRFKQKIYVKKADACLCVSQGNMERLCEIDNGKYVHKIYTVYNGYEQYSVDNIETISNNTSNFRICYTGTIFGGMRKIGPLFRALKNINTKIPVIIDYAGNDFKSLLEDANEYGLQDSLVNHGYLSRSEVIELQRQADLFLVLSWNTKYDQGILTGKFYEALQHRKPIVALVDGDFPGSELKQLIDNYHLGICYEEATSERSFQELQEYIEHQISRKLQGKDLDYFPDESVFTLFEYGNIAKEVERIMNELVL